jgi:hypothetical protein
MSDSKNAGLDQHIAELQQDLEDALALKKLLEKNPQLARFTAHEFGHVVVGEKGVRKKGGRKKGGRKKGVGKNVDKNGAPNDKSTRGPTIRGYCRKIVEAIEATKGAGLSVADLEEKTDLKRVSIQQVIYRSFRELFTPTRSPDDARVKVWQLKPGAPAMLDKLDKA